jgi:hypothetical protein
MAQAKISKQKKQTNGANVGYEAELWQMADALRGSMDAAEYKRVEPDQLFDDATAASLQGHGYGG